MIGAMIIAVDGSAASGKGTLSKRLADHFNLAHLDTGSLFRALALQLLNAGTEIDIMNENNIQYFLFFESHLTSIMPTFTNSSIRMGN